jgi:hypothetical protein
MTNASRHLQSQAKRWLGKSGQSDKWISCLTAAKLPRIRSENDEANAADA